MINHVVKATHNKNKSSFITIRNKRFTRAIFIRGINHAKRKFTQEDVQVR
ncbi:hypothetical protein WCO01_17820 [Weissella confusa]|jgi:hypothetical protein|nr:hypothetical protein WCO01_17820 [Weissella confusa]